MANKRILVAGIGNVLRGDDGFGVQVARRLIQRDGLPGGVKVIELGIAGISLVQELLDRYDGLIVVDAMDRNGAPGTVYVEEPHVPDLNSSQPAGRVRFLVDMHDTEPFKAFILAKALGVLPRRVWVVGCQPHGCDELSETLSEPVQKAVGKATELIDSLLGELLESATR